MATAAPFHRVVVIGSGFGALQTAKSLASERHVEVLLIARTNHHLFQPLLYQVATGVLSPGEIAPATREILRRQDNVRVLGGEVTEIDLAARTVTSLSPVGELTVTYDSLVVAAGASQSYFGKNHFAEFAPGMKSVDDALELRGRIFGAFEAAELAATQGASTAEIERLVTFVVVGAGPTGVEMAGQIAELAQRTLRRDFRAIDPRAARVVLIDAVPTVLSSFGDRLSARAERGLRERGVEVLLSTMVTDVDLEGVSVRDPDGTERRIEASCKVWAAGVAASPLGAMLAAQCGAATDRAGRIAVEPDLSLPGHPEVFCVGDMIALDDLPGVAQVAIQGGKHAAKIIKRRVRRPQAGVRPGPAFSYFDKGSMATISRFKAVASVGPLRLSGFIAWLMWLVIHLVYLVGFKNRITTLLHWFVSFIGRGRSERVITAQQVMARRALAADGEGDPVSRPWRPAAGIGQATPGVAQASARVDQATAGVGRATPGAAPTSPGEAQAPPG